MHPQFGTSGGRMGPGILNRLRQMRVLLLEILLEHRRQMVRSLIIARGTLPMLARNENSIGHTMA